MPITSATPEKIFVIGLPRTATTSLCQAMLTLGFKTTHCAYTNNSIVQAQVIADTPVFNDYPLLDKAFPNSRFILLERPLALWLPSIRQLLLRMFTNLTRDDGGFNPHLRRCFNRVFHPLTLDNITSDRFLTQCYITHRKQALAFFAERENDLLQLDISQPDSYQRLLNFLALEPPAEQQGFHIMNKGGKVTAWQAIKHPLKVESTRQGKIDKRLYHLDIQDLSGA